MKILVIRLMFLRLNFQEKKFLKTLKTLKKLAEESQILALEKITTFLLPNPQG
jgi:hypothetical protein